jgi:hypothetical protein
VVQEWWSAVCTGYHHTMAYAFPRTQPRSKGRTERWEMTPRGSNSVETW